MFKEKDSKGSNGSAAGSSNGIDSFTRGFVRKSARELAGRFGFKKQDRDEIEQRLYLKLARELHRADPQDRKWKAFVAITVRRHIVSMIRDNEAAKRDHRRACSLHVTVGTPDGPMELAYTIGEHEIPSRRGCVKRSPQELTDGTDAGRHRMPLGSHRRPTTRVLRATETRFDLSNRARHGHPADHAQRLAGQAATAVRGARPEGLPVTAFRQFGGQPGL